MNTILNIEHMIILPRNCHVPMADKRPFSGMLLIHEFTRTVWGFWVADMIWYDIYIYVCVVVCVCVSYEYLDQNDDSMRYSCKHVDKFTETEIWLHGSCDFCVPNKCPRPSLSVYKLFITATLTRESQWFYQLFSFNSPRRIYIPKKRLCVVHSHQPIWGHPNNSVLSPYIWPWYWQNFHGNLSCKVRFVNIYLTVILTKLSWEVIFMRSGFPSKKYLWSPSSQSGRAKMGGIDYFVTTETSLLYPTKNPWLSTIKWIQIAKFMGPTWGPPGSCRPQMGPLLAPWTLLSGKYPHIQHRLVTCGLSKICTLLYGGLQYLLRLCL